MLRITMLVIALAWAPATASLAFDLTGTWEGKWSCKIFSFGEKSKESEKDSVMQITQTGDTIFVHLDAVDRYSGVAIADAAKPDKGMAGIAACSTDNDLVEFAGWDEIVQWKVKTKPDKGKGSIKGSSVWSDPGQHIATCKYKYKRVDTADPAVPGCP